MKLQHERPRTLQCHGASRPMRRTRALLAVLSVLLIASGCAGSTTTGSPLSQATVAPAASPISAATTSPTPSPVPPSPVPPSPVPPSPEPSVVETFTIEPAVDPIRPETVIDDLSSPATAADIHAWIDIWIEENAGGYFLDASDGALVASCPLSVNCDENYFYFAVRDRPTGIYISFDAAVLNDMTLDGLRSNVNYLNFGYPIAEYGSWRIAVGEYDPIEVAQIEIEDFTNGQLVLTGVADKVFLQAWDTDFSRCVPQADISNLECRFFRDVEMPITVRVSMPMATSGIDCTEASIHDAEPRVCG